MAKRTNYASKTETDDFESLGDRLAADLRKSIRQLVSSPSFPLSSYNQLTLYSVVLLYIVRSSIG